MLLLGDLWACRETECARGRIFKLVGGHYTTWATAVLATNLAVENLPARGRAARPGVPHYRTSTAHAPIHAGRWTLGSTPDRSAA